jgi:predicted ester cyclase
MKQLASLFIIIGLTISACINNNSNLSNQSTTIAQHQDSIKQFLHDYVDEIWNQRDFSKADKYWGTDFKNVFAPQFDHGPEGMKNQVAYFLSAFQPFHFEIKDMMIDGARISMWIEISGTHTGELFGIRPTNKQVKFREAVWYEMKEGKLDKVYPFVDWNALFEQLGQYPKIETK